MTVEIFDKCQRVPNVDGEEEKGVAHNKLIVWKMGWVGKRRSVPWAIFMCFAN